MTRPVGPPFCWEVPEPCTPSLAGVVWDSTAGTFQEVSAVSGAARLPMASLDYARLVLQSVLDVGQSASLLESIMMRLLGPSL